MIDPSPAAGAASTRVEATANWFRRIFGQFNPLRVIGGFLLAFLVVAAAGAAVIFFAAAQFQSRIAELTLNGAPLTIWRVDEFRAEFVSWTSDIRKLRDGIAQDRINLAKDRQNNLVQAAEHADQLARLDNDVRSLKQRIVAALPKVADDGSNKGARQAISSESWGGSASETYVSENITQVELLLTDDNLQKRFGEEVAQARLRYNAIVDMGSKIKSKSAEIAGYETWITSLEDRRKERIDTAAKLFGESNNAAAPELVERIVNMSSELSSLSKIWHGVIYRTALWTNDMLVLSLLISMGVLGSALNLLAIFFTNDQESLSFGEYPLRLAFGAVLAIVMFIIAKAGVPILADTSKIGSNAPLNPYFISLLAVVSGLMSDRSMAAIRNVATTLLQSVGGADFSQRYSRLALDDLLKAANREIDALAQVLAMSAEDTRKLFSGNDLVSPDRQRLISAFFGRPIRELFSDLPAT
jgi:hypothetical protein